MRFHRLTLLDKPCRNHHNPRLYMQPFLLPNNFGAPPGRCSHPDEEVIFSIPAAYPACTERCKSDKSNHFPGQAARQQIFYFKDDKMPSIRVKENEPFEVAMRRFKRAIEKTGLLTELRAREAYEKPTTERKRKKAAAVKRLQKRLRSQQLPPKLY